jgi:hypothetical protein
LIGKHCQAAKRAAADLEGHSATAKFSQPGRLDGGSMIASHYAQAILIKMATDGAVDKYLTDPYEPIEKVEVGGEKIVVTAGARRLTMNYHTSHSGRASGPWTWNFTSPDVQPLTLIERLKRLMRRRKRS